jgi:alpha-tubulin suppressor-like RCC1 family protein
MMKGRNPVAVGLIGLAIAAGACGASIEGNHNVTPLLGVAAISAGGSHTCALMIDGTPRCWGSNIYGELAAPAVDMQTSVPVSLSLPGITQISAGGEQTCALLQAGAIDCWGRNQFGQIGNGTASPAEPNPVPVAGIPDAVWVGTNGPSLYGEAFVEDYSCALLADGRVACWGQDVGGEIGDGTNQVYVPSPSIVPGLQGVQSLALSGTRVYAVLADGTVQAWGSDGDVSSTSPVAVPGLSGVVSVAGAEKHACALLSDGTVDCWGDNFGGELGQGTFYGDSAVPLPVPGLSNVVAIDASSGGNCALLGDGTVRCWGDDTFGELGDNGTVGQAASVPVLNVTGAVAISSGETFNCALLSDTSVKCWGMNESGQLGNDDTSIEGVRLAVTVVQPKP